MPGERNPSDMVIFLHCISGGQDALSQPAGQSYAQPFGRTPLIPFAQLPSVKLPGS